MDDTLRQTYKNDVPGMLISVETEYLDAYTLKPVTLETGFGYEYRLTIVDDDREILIFLDGCQCNKYSLIQLTTWFLWRGISVKCKWF
ncbi:hypothetical protein RCL_jg6020.t2 [Rhizophagus clarus]|uniref:Uncharacterized protein n=1 Tax=Rhizophagus clarus TaxID=94130 RepID=A0A8H3L510_9GLOM|nr:hypothetical protein RCL_jg6020.t2 [Rhizophagus clarus]